MVLKMVNIDLPLSSFSSRGDQEKSLPNGATSGRELFHTQPQERLCEQTHKTQFMTLEEVGFPKVMLPAGTQLLSAQGHHKKGIFVNILP